MAKAKKPASGSKPPSQTSKTAAEKDTGSGDKPSETSSASKAAAAKSAKTVSTPTTGADTGTSATPSGSKSSASKAAESSAAKASTAPKTPAAEKADTSKKPDTSKPAATKVDATKSSVASKAPEDKPSSSKSPTTASKSDTPEKSEPKDSGSMPPSRPTPRSEPAQQKVPEKSGSVFWPFVLGGVIAAALGFAASEMNVFNTRVETDDIRVTLGQQQEQIAALENAEPVTVPDAPDLGAIEADLASIAENIATMEIRLTALENRPTPSGDAPAPTPDYSDELAALTASVQAQKAEIDRLLENAQTIEEATAEAARRAAVQSALTKITAALNAGGGYADAVGELSDSGVTEVPDAIAAPANDGVATLLNLQSDFPDTARSALAAARSAGADGDEGGVGGFLRRQLGARSVAPREGSDPDAVLSRAEAAVREGRLADALSELETLPPEAQAAMEDWLSNARARADAEAAVEDLSQRLTAN